MLSPALQLSLLCHSQPGNTQPMSVSPRLSLNFCHLKARLDMVTRKTPFSHSSTLCITVSERGYCTKDPDYPNWLVRCHSHFVAIKWTYLFTDEITEHRFIVVLIQSSSFLQEQTKAFILDSNADGKSKRTLQKKIRLKIQTLYNKLFDRANRMLSYSFPC